MNLSCSKALTLTIQSAIPPIQGYWTFDEVGGAPSRFDKLNNLLLATIVGDNGFPSITPGLIGNALAITSMPGVSAINPNGDPTGNTTFPPLRCINGQFSFWFWFNVRDWTNNYTIFPTIFFACVFPQANINLTIKWLANVQQLGVAFTDVNGVGFNPAHFTPVLNAWTFLHLFVNATTFGYSINNGAPILAAGSPTLVDTGSNQFIQIFQQSNGGGLNDTAVAIDELGVLCGSVLTPNQLAFLFNGGAGRTWPLSGFPSN